ncbi:MAG: hypothetical protein ACR2OO_07415 [Thermomicrobiales bacterium]
MDARRDEPSSVTPETKRRDGGAVVWGALAAAAALAAGLAALLACLVWRAQLGARPQPMLPELQARSEMLHDCLSAARTSAEATACGRITSLPAASPPWPTTHVGWMATAAVMIMGRSLVVWGRGDGRWTR